MHRFPLHAPEIIHTNTLQFGPIIAGTTIAALGPFIPLNNGFACISDGVPVIMQGALFTSTVFHFMVNDTTGYIGITMRAILGTYSEKQIKALLALCWMCTSVGQVFWGPTFNPVYGAVYWGLSQFPRVLPMKQASLKE